MKTINPDDVRPLDVIAIKEILTIALIQRAVKLDCLTLNCVNLIDSTVDAFSASAKIITGDTTVVPIALFLRDHADQFTIGQLTAILYATSKSFTLAAGASAMGTREIAKQMIYHSRSPIDSMKFIAKVVLDYDGSLPTLKQWSEIMEMDKKDELLNLSPAIAFAISGTSEDSPRASDNNGTQKLRHQVDQLHKLSS